MSVLLISHASVCATRPRRGFICISHILAHYWGTVERYATASWCCPNIAECQGIYVAYVYGVLSRRILLSGQARWSSPSYGRSDSFAVDWRVHISFVHVHARVTRMWRAVRAFWHLDLCVGETHCCISFESEIRIAIFARSRLTWI
jgi:hypothetical protein